jgi:NAD(P)-dependent dehydrogenase (short-subunit alcohol dehydrogenase family)
MAIERRVKEHNLSREQARTERRAQMPLLVTNAGNAFDVANAAVFLASDEARYITGVLPPVGRASAQGRLAGGYSGSGAGVAS